MSSQALLQSHTETNKPQNVPKNKGFKQVHELFIENNWILSNNEENYLVYSNPSNLYDEFCIKMLKFCNSEVYRITVINK